MRAVSTPPIEVNDQYVLLRHVPWVDYERLLRVRGESAKPRMTYAKGALELMSPSDHHENAKTMIARLLEAYALARGLEFNGHGSTTYKDRSRQVGIEPDECYDFGGDTDYPDLAIEVVWTNLVRIDRLAIYALFRVREVWVWEDGALVIYRLQSGRYSRVKKSKLLPELDLALFAGFVERRDQTKAVREFMRAIEEK